MTRFVRVVPFGLYHKWYLILDIVRYRPWSKVDQYVGNSVSFGTPGPFGPKKGGQ